MSFQIEMPWKTLVFYRNCLPAPHKDIYDAIYKGLCSWKEEIVFPVGVSAAELSEIYTMVMRDYPMLFHVRSSFRITMSKTASIYPDYIMTQNDYGNYAAAVKTFLIKCRRKTDQLNNFEKVKVLHDSMVKHIVYYGINEDNSHNILGAILDRKGVCESIAKSFKAMCDICLVPSIVVFGVGNLEPGKPATEENHAWNMVNLDGEWFNIDVTHDAGLSEYEKSREIRYDYFCRSDGVILRDHSVLTKYKPISRRDFSMYRAMHLVANKESDITRIIQLISERVPPTISFEYNLNVPDIEASLQSWVGPAIGQYASGYSKYSLSINKACNVASISLHQ